MPTKVNIVKYKNIFDSGADVLVCPVNCVGVMGAGLALAFKNIYPACFKEYRNACKGGLLEIGRPWLWNNPDGKDVLFFPTKDLWTKPSKIEYIIEGLDYLVNVQSEMGITSICFPLLGVGCGKLDRKKTSKVMYKYLCQMDGFVSMIV